MAWTVAPVASCSRRPNMMVGTAAYTSTVAPVTPIESSAIAAPGDDAGPSPYRIEERGHLMVGLTATVEAPPQPAEVTDQLVARVDGHDEALGGVTIAADQHGFDVGLEGSHHRVGGFDLAPRVER